MSKFFLALDQGTTSSRLEIAKFLFNRCIDKENYFEIANELQFSSSKTELNDYVKSRL